MGSLMVGVQQLKPIIDFCTENADVFDQYLALPISPFAIGGGEGGDELTNFVTHRLHFACRLMHIVLESRVHHRTCVFACLGQNCKLFSNCLVQCFRVALQACADIQGRGESRFGMSLEFFGGGGAQVLHVIVERLEIAFSRGGVALRNSTATAGVIDKRNVRCATHPG